MYAWPVPVTALRPQKFKIDSYNAEVRPDRGTFGIIQDMDLYVEGRAVDSLPVPMFLTAYAPREQRVQKTRTCKRPDCQRDALLVVYESGLADIVCATCGRRHM